MTPKTTRKSTDKQLDKRTGWTNGLARASIRSRPASFIGTFVALLATAVVAMACGTLLQTGITARVEPVRYSNAPIVVAADQFARRTVMSAGDREHIAGVLPEGARIDVSLADEIAAVTDVATAVPDVAFEFIGDDTGAITGRDWQSRVLHPDGGTLVEGSGPGAGEVVIDALTAREAGLTVGDHVRMRSPTKTRSFRVSGIAARRAATAADHEADGRRPTAWFVDGFTAAFAGHPERADAIAVDVDDGAAVATVAGRLRAALPDGIEVHTGSARGALEAPTLPTAQELLIGLGGSFGGVATFAAIFVVITTMALVIGQRQREIALLRAIGATPRQIRRMIATETLLIAPLAGLAGILPGLFLARWWFGQLVERGGVPEGMHLSVGLVPAVAAVGAGLLAALAGGYGAARRPARTRPSQALGEAAVERRPLGRLRWALGGLFIGLGVFLSVLSYQLSGGSAAVASIGVVMMFLIAVAMLGPVIARVAVAVLGLPLRRGGAASSLAATNAAANSRRLASAITPIALVIGASGVLLFIQPTVAAATRADVRQGLVAEYVVTGDDPGLPTSAVARVVEVPGVDAAVGVLRTDVLTNGFEEFVPTTAIGVTGDTSRLDRVLDLGIQSGSLDDVAPGTAAIDSLLADALDAQMGDTVELRLGDGTAYTPTVVAIYDHGLGLGQVVLPYELLAGHVRAAYDSEVLVSRADGADPDVVAARLGAIGLPGISVTDRAGYAAQIDQALELDAWANRVMAAVFGGFAAIAAINTLVMVVLDRRREVALLRLTGTTRRQVQAMFRWEAAMVAATGIGLGSAIALITLQGFAHGATGGSPYVPVLQGVGVVLAAATIAFGAVAIPTRVVLRRRPTSSG